MYVLIAYKLSLAITQRVQKYSFLIPERSVVQTFPHGGAPDIKFHIAVPSYENVCRPEKVDNLGRGRGGVGWGLRFSFCQVIVKKICLELICTYVSLHFTKTLKPFSFFFYYPIIFLSIQVSNKNKIYLNIASFRTKIPALFQGIFG